MKAFIVTVLLTVLQCSKALPLKDDGSDKGMQLFNAILNKNSNLCKKLIEDENTDPNFRAMGPKNKVWGVLTLAVYQDLPDVTLLLIKAGANIEEKDSSSYTPLLMAARYGYWSVAEVLLKNGANTEARETAMFSLTPLLMATGFGHVHTVAGLLKYGADIEARSSAKRTALHVATRWNKVDVIKVLLKANANVEAMEENEDTPLHFAATFDRLEIAKLLLAHGAGVNPENLNGQTPLDLAKSNEMSSYLISKGGQRG